MNNNIQITTYKTDSTYKKMRGRFCEAVATHLLLKQHYKILKKNYYTSAGEVDIIISKGQFVIFVEVKSWGCFSDIALEKVISKRKLHRLRQCAEQYLEYGEGQSLKHTRMCVRFDVILITISHYKMVHYKGV